MLNPTDGRHTRDKTSNQANYQRTCRWSQWILLLGVMGALSQSVIAQNTKPDRQSAIRLPSEGTNPNVQFLWRFAAKGPTATNWTPILGDTNVSLGTQLRIYVRLKKPCYVYVICRDSSEAVSRLFPTYPLDNKATNQVEQDYWLPSVDRYYYVDRPNGKEVFYLVASNERLRTLEDRLAENEKMSGNDSLLQGKEIISEIWNLRTSRGGILNPVAEEPTTIAGLLRGDHNASAIEIKANQFYCKSYTIAHHE